MQVARSIALVALLAAPAASAEIYQWVDAEGRQHFTQDLSRVPPEHRAQAREREEEKNGGGSYQRVERAASAPTEAPSAPADGSGAHRIRVQRAGTRLLVNVRLNHSVTAPFVIDTGASDVVIPQAVADELGLQVGSETRTMVYATANGLVEQPLVTLRTVELGDARVENVPASISASMPVGLLGLSFFNHFTYEIDAARGLVTLVPNDLAETGAIRGGRSEAQWRTEYRSLAARLAQLEAERARTPSSRSRKLHDLEEARAVLERQLEALETEAFAARVPASWRE